MYRLTDIDKRTIDRIAKALSLRVEVIDDEMTDTLLEINGTHTVDRLDDGKFLVCHITVIHGCRYHSDGSGTPDDVDVTELDTFPRFIEALASAVSLAAHQMTFEAAESVHEDLAMESHEEQIFG